MRPLSLAAVLLVIAPEAGHAQDRIAWVVPVVANDEASAPAFLAGVAAACAVGGRPMVFAVDPATPWRPELLDFFARWGPSRLVVVGDLQAPPDPFRANVVAVTAGSPEATACAIAAQAWTASPRAVLADQDDRDAAFAAAVLAARLRIPWLPCGRGAVGDAVRAQLAAFGTRRVFAVGPGAPAKLDGVRVEHLADALDVARTLHREGQRIAYLAATNPHDASAPHAAQLSLAAVLLAAGREGALVPTPHDVLWKVATPTQDDVTEAPPGAHASRGAWRRGALDVGGASRVFLTGIDPADGRAWCQLDRDGDGRFDGQDEGPWRSGAVIALASRRVALDLDVDEHARGRSLALTAPVADELVAAIGRIRNAVSPRPATLCLVGWPDTLPMAIVGDAQSIDCDLVSDLPLAQCDDDPFADFAYARFVAEDVAAGTLLACRGFAIDELRDPSWAKRFATAEWETVNQDLLRRAGFEFAGHHDGGAPLAAGSPATSVALLSHGSHAMWTVMGKTYTWDSTTLLAPCFVESSGCSTAALDIDQKRRSVVTRLFRNGAVAFAGNARRGTAQQELFRSETLNGWLAGRTLGEAHRDAINKTLVAVLERGETNSGVQRYQLHAAACYGDPGLALGGADASDREAARVTASGLRATVHGPKRYDRSEYPPNPEWGCAAKRLFTWHAPGLGVESAWFPPEKRNQDALVFTAEHRTRRRVRGVEAIDDPDGPLHFTGKCFVDEHDDGTRSVFWRVRLIDFDMNSGEVRAQRDRAAFRLIVE